MSNYVADLNELTTPAANDFLLVSDVSDVLDPDKKMQLQRLAIKLGTPVADRIASWNDANQIKDGGFLVSDFARKTGTPAAGRVASWVDANTIQDGGYLTADVVRKTGTPVANNLARWNAANVVDDGGFAVADISRLSTAQSYAALKTFSSGLAFGGAPQSTLNWYEEGTWTPALTFGGLSTGMVVNTAVGRFTRTGNVVYAWGRMTLTNKGTATGAALIAGLPYPAATVTGLQFSVTFHSSFTTHIDAITGIASTNTILMYQNAAGTITQFAETNFTNNTQMAFSVTYRI